MATNNAIDNKSTSRNALRINAGSSTTGSVTLSTTLSSVTFPFGIDGTSSDFFMGTGASNKLLNIDSNGIVTKPEQPAFLAYLSATANNVTGDGTSYTVACNTEVFDQGSDYDNASTYTFTAPVTGRYLFFGNTYFVNDPTSGGNTYSFKIITSNRTYFALYINSRRNMAGFYGDQDAIAQGSAYFADMDAGDTAYLVSQNYNGSKVDDVYGGNCYTWFGGYLVC